MASTRIQDLTEKTKLAKDDLIFVSDSEDLSGSYLKAKKVKVSSLGLLNASYAIGSIGGGTQDLDLDNGSVFSATVDSATTTFTFSNPLTSGQICKFKLILTNGGSQTVNWPASVVWAGGTGPSLTASGVDVLEFFTIDGGSTWYGESIGLDFS